MTKIPNVAATAIACNMSVRDTLRVGNSVLFNYGLADEQNKELLMGPKKVMTNYNGIVRHQDDYFDLFQIIHYLI